MVRAPKLPVGSGPTKTVVVSWAEVWAPVAVVGGSVVDMAVVVPASVVRGVLSPQKPSRAWNAVGC